LDSASTFQGSPLAFQGDWIEPNTDHPPKKTPQASKQTTATADPDTEAFQIEEAKGTMAWSNLDWVDWRSIVAELATALGGRPRNLSFVLERLRMAARAADRVAEQADGGMAVYLFSPREQSTSGASERFVMFDCGSDGVAVLFKDRASGTARAEDLSDDDGQADRQVREAVRFVSR
jgi:hypothetical protein